MKKLFAIMLALILVLCLAACGGEEAPAPNEPEQEISQPEQEETPTEPETPAEDEVDPKRGTVTDNVYKNEAFGVSFTAGSEWYFMSDEEIAATMSISAEEMFTEEYAEMLKEATIIYDVYATNLTTGSSVNVNYENLGIVYGAIFDEKGYLEISKTQLETQLAEVDSVSLKKCEVSAVSVSGAEVPCLEVELDYGGIVIYEKILAKKTGSWMGAITLASPTAEEIESLLAAVNFE